MELVFMYGPAAVGKLTVARELSQRTGYPVFDNHLSIDYAARLLEWNSPAYVQLLRGLRLFTLQTMAELDAEGLIFTFIYTPPGSDGFVRQVLELCQQAPIQPHFVKLEARREVLLERVTRPERKALKKLSRPERLRWMLDEQRANEAIPYVDSLVVDTSDQPPERSAEQILLGLNLASGSQGSDELTV